MELPVELWNCIFSYLNSTDLLSIAQIKYFNKIVKFNIKEYKQKKILLLVNDGYSYIEKIYINEGYKNNKTKIYLKKVITILIEYSWFSVIDIELLIFILMEWIYSVREEYYRSLIASHRGIKDYTYLYQNGLLDEYADKIKNLLDDDILSFFSECIF